MSVCNKNGWIKGLPKTPGIFWLYSYRYGRGINNDKAPEILLATVHEVTNGLMIVANGQTVFNNEIENPFYKQADLPEPPEDFFTV